MLSGVDLAAPSLVAFEAANVIRRHELAGLIGADQAAQAHADLLDLAIEHWPYEVVAKRAWELRATCRAATRATSPRRDQRATLVTLDRRIGRVPNLTCTIATPS